ncbi:MAG: amidase [Anaerolineales bacterium]|uniref:Amidase n=1 Tax=Candidatus Desulfolinea nitratireducens TaxID=2841698 RepID=A0A8J6NNK9_9CHLR|nr:amidase [Candidatus Desulfolinea nitratireducens]MBL6960950.1 amidase [Anaerolineales bacterium]
MNLAPATNALRTSKLTIPKFLSELENYFSSREPSVLAFLPEEKRFQRLQMEAEELFGRFPDPENRPPLFGMLVGVKDIFHVNGFPTQAGSRLPSEELQGPQAESVTRLKNAGALILGKTVTTEFAYFSPGPTRNPHNPEHTPGGSSSGSAAAVGAGLCSLALGTQTIGSVIRPASFCGVIGFKPTYKRISRDGVIPVSSSLDHIGYFTPNLGIAREVAPVLIDDWNLRTVDPFPIIGIPDGPYLQNASDEALSCFRSNCQSLAEAGYELRHISVMDDFLEIRTRHTVIMSTEAAQVHKRWFEKYENLYSTKFIELVHQGKSITGSELVEALSARDTFRVDMTKTMDEENIDVWISPSAVGPAPKGLESTGDPIMNLPWTQLGFPTINLPAGMSSSGLPLGLQVTGKALNDENLLAWAEELEKLVGYH